MSEGGGMTSSLCYKVEGTQVNNETDPERAATNESPYNFGQGGK